MKPSSILYCALVGVSVLMTSCSPYGAGYGNGTVAHYIPATAGTATGEILVDPLTSVSTCSRISMTDKGWAITPEGIAVGTHRSGPGGGVWVPTFQYAPTPSAPRCKEPARRSTSAQRTPTSAPRTVAAHTAPSGERRVGTVGSEVFP